MNRDRTARRATSGADGKAIVSMVAAGRPNPFAAGSPEHIAYSWAGELLRHAESASTGDLARHARRIFPKAGRRHAARQAAGSEPTETAAAVPPAPEENPRRPSLNIVPPVPSAKPAPPKLPIVDIWAQSDLFPVSRRFADEIDRAENSNDEWDKASPTDALGRYQLRWRALTDIGLMQDKDTWRLHGLPDRQEFLLSPLLQNLAFAAYLQTMRNYLDSNGADEYIGQSIEGKVDTFDVTESGLLAAAHRYGQGNVLAYLKHQAGHDWVTDQSTFGENEGVFLAIETRLREFANIPLRSSPNAPPLVNPAIFE